MLNDDAADRMQVGEGWNNLIQGGGENELGDKISMDVDGLGNLVGGQQGESQGAKVEQNKEVGG